MGTLHDREAGEVLGLYMPCLLYTSSLDEICEELNQKIRNGEVDDYASKALKSLRETIDRTDDKMHQKAEAALRANKSYMSDSFSTVKNGHLCIPVKKEYRFKIAGAVIDKSATGSTLFVEPAAVAALYDELQELRIDEENEVIRILYTLSGLLSDKEEIIKKNNRTVEKLDFIFAKAKLSLENGGTQPEINTERYIKLKDARHPPVSYTQLDVYKRQSLYYISCHPGT